MLKTKTKVWKTLLFASLPSWNLAYVSRMVNIVKKFFKVDLRTSPEGGDPLHGRL